MLVLFLLMVFTALLVGWLAIPNDGLDSFGRRRGSSPIKPAFDFVIGIAILALVISLPIGVVLYVVDQHVMPLGIVSHAVATGVSEPGALSSGPFNTRQSYIHWAFSKGSTFEDAGSMATFMLTALPVIFAVIAVLLLVLSRLSGGFLDAAVHDLQEETRLSHLASVRQEYHQRNQRRIERRRRRRGRNWS